MAVWFSKYVCCRREISHGDLDIRTSRSVLYRAWCKSVFLFCRIQLEHRSVSSTHPHPSSESFCERARVDGWKLAGERGG